MKLYGRWKQCMQKIVIIELEPIMVDEIMTKHFVVIIK